MSRGDQLIELAEEVEDNHGTSSNPDALQEVFERVSDLLNSGDDTFSVDTSNKNVFLLSFYFFFSLLLHISLTPLISLGSKSIMDVCNKGVYSSG